jgi:hypothetical protein
VTPGEVAAAAGSRVCDVYLGVDVHGRGTYGGGKVGGGQPRKLHTLPCADMRVRSLVDGL